MIIITIIGVVSFVYGLSTVLSVEDNTTIERRGWIMTIGGVALAIWSIYNL